MQSPIKRHCEGLRGFVHKPDLRQSHSFILFKGLRLGFYNAIIKRRLLRRRKPSFKFQLTKWLLAMTNLVETHTKASEINQKSHKRDACACRGFLITCRRGVHQPLTANKKSTNEPHQPFTACSINVPSLTGEVTGSPDSV